MKKYELTEERNEDGLYQIRALIDISRHGVKAGDLGGWIESEHNLSHEGDCWVGEDAWVYGDAQVYGDAVVCGYAEVLENARVHGYARVCGDAVVRGRAVLTEGEIR